MFDFDDRYRGGSRAVLVNVNFSETNACEDLDELRMLVLSSGVEIAGIISCSRKVPDPRLFIGSGKTEELKALIEEKKAETVIFNHELSPSQERNLERELGVKVITRTALILDIFAARAHTREGTLQVELAQLHYLETRLVRGWTHLERQRGGFGMRGGPGETQLESDRRMLRDRVVILRNELDEVEKQRTQSSRARVKNGIPVVSLVGYTNAGKSTLFNSLTKASVYTADQLFATLDPTLRTVTLPEIGKIIFSDTVGFIRHLPCELVAAFRSTLKETRDADLELHVIDSSDDQMSEKINSVNTVLDEIGASSVPVLLVYNKIDRLDGVVPHIEYDETGKPLSVSISAASGTGLDLLLKAVASRLCPDLTELTVKLIPAMGSLRAALYECGSIVSEKYDDDGSAVLEIRQKFNVFAVINSKFDNALEHSIIKPAGFSFKKKENF